MSWLKFSKLDLFKLEMCFVENFMVSELCFGAGVGKHLLTCKTIKRNIVPVPLDPDNKKG